MLSWKIVKPPLSTIIMVPLNSLDSVEIYGNNSNIDTMNIGRVIEIHISTHGKRRE